MMGFKKIHYNEVIPELVETEIGESIGARTQSLSTFQELGPPDLVHLTKRSSSHTEIGTYHHVLGTDVWSCASATVYLQNMSFTQGETQLWFGKRSGYKVHSGVLCCYNAFSKQDVRVSMKIPGGCDAYVLDERGEKRPMLADTTLWLETYMSGILRSFLFTDDETYFVNGCRKINPLGIGAKATQEALDQFLEAFEKLFFKGPLLGSKPIVQLPTLVNNYLVDGLFKFLTISHAFGRALAVLERLQSRTSTPLASLIARLHLMNQQEIKAVKVMAAGIHQHPRDAPLLLVQAQYCYDKSRYDLALKCATKAVNASPSEFEPWALLVKCYTKLANYEQALLALNSCPMFTYHEPFLYRLPTPHKYHFPESAYGRIPEVWNYNGTDNGNGSTSSSNNASDTVIETTNGNDQEFVDPGLLKLPAPSLRATFAKAYELLTEIVKHIGWDSLLKYRSIVFVMEEEYRKGNRSNEDSIPAGSTSSPDEHDTSTNGNVQEFDEVSLGGSKSAPLTANGNIKSINQTTGIRDKRLCERWLDNLFMVLYEDLRVYTVWRAEFIHYQSQQLKYKKSALEWEILGGIAFRMRHYDEAMEALSNALSGRFSSRAMWKLLDLYEMKIKELVASENNRTDRLTPSTSASVPASNTSVTPSLTTSATSVVANNSHNSNNNSGYTVAKLSDKILDVTIRLLSWNHRWYNEFSPKLFVIVHEISDRDGYEKLTNIVRAKYGGPSYEGVDDLVMTYLNSLKYLGFDNELK
ncbi:chaps-domain-containing protein [Nadsonia fulvescens var. elongata DSM 6958]|uniref:Chaps-domain-containing protein n=1 Tax=Nadsonia fulvescens var. elongata DSM 6958 TaxID=857566 RepID=A0A1E3PEF3_9ASCO|nr:chaps-domain-containing protein [Nadsonia fulvescens var. elongata DSM 6958]